MTQNTFKPRMQMNDGLWNHSMPKRNGKKNYYNDRSSNNSFKNNRFTNETRQVEKKKEINFDLEIDFPSMNNENTETKKHTNDNEYKKKILLETIEEEEEEQLPNGWVSYQGYKGSRKVDVSYSGKASVRNNFDMNEDNTIETTIKVIESLCILYEKYVNNYVSSWGEEEYERMYEFPNHDIDYFDKIDELEDLEISESDSDNFDSDEEAWNKIYRY